MGLAFRTRQRVSTSRKRHLPKNPNLFLKWSPCETHSKWLQTPCRIWAGFLGSATRLESLLTRAWAQKQTARSVATGRSSPAPSWALCSRAMRSGGRRRLRPTQRLVVLRAVPQVQMRAHGGSLRFQQTRWAGDMKTEAAKHLRAHSKRRAAMGPWRARLGRAVRMGPRFVHLNRSRHPISGSPSFSTTLPG